jgi:hypothetical protein
MLVHMNFYAASVALLWTTAMQLGAPDAGAPRSVRRTAARRGVDPETMMARPHRWRSREGRPAG